MTPSPGPPTPPMPPDAPPAGVSAAASALGLAALLAIGLGVALQPRGPAVSGSGDQDKSCAMAGGGYLRGPLYGDLALRLNFRNEELQCEGMLRPDEGGLRLMFAGHPPGGDGQARIVLILGISGQLAGLAGGERMTNVTLIDERDGRFYSARGPGRCFSAVRQAEPLAGTGDRLWRIEGDLYCAGALPSLKDMASVTLGTLRFAGRLDVDAP